MALRERFFLNHLQTLLLPSMAKEGSQVVRLDKAEGKEKAAARKQELAKKIGKGSGGGKSFLKQQGDKK